MVLGRTLAKTYARSCKHLGRRSVATMFGANRLTIVGN
jgi:hypothetical protein